MLLLLLLQKMGEFSSLHHLSISVLDVWLLLLLLRLLMAVQRGGAGSGAGPGGRSSSS